MSKAIGVLGRTRPGHKSGLLFSNAAKIDKTLSSSFGLSSVTNALIAGDFGMAIAGRYFFRCASDAHRQITELFDFISPTVIALWNLRWQVQGFVTQVPAATSSDLSNRFALGSGMRGGEIKRATVEHTWDDQLEQFAKFVLVAVIASFEDFTALLAASATSDTKLRERLSRALQFPGGTARIPGAPTRDSAFAVMNQPASELSGVFVRDPRQIRRYSGPKVDNLLLCYRYFKSARNAIAHSGGRASDELVNNYNRFANVANASALGLKEVPRHHPVSKVGDPVKIDLRGVTGLSDVILRIVTTYDVDLAETRMAKTEVVSRLRSQRINRSMIASSRTRPGRRVQSILAPLRAAGLPDATLTPSLEAMLKAEMIIPEYA